MRDLSFNSDVGNIRHRNTTHRPSASPKLSELIQNSQTVDCSQKTNSICALIRLYSLEHSGQFLWLI